MRETGCARPVEARQVRAATLTADRAISMADLPKPDPSTGAAALIKVEAAGVCGTDLHFLDGLLDPSGAPRVLGHEIAGVVVEGERPLPGSRVALYNILFCGDCAYCRSGRQRLCTNSGGMLGFNVDGGFAEYVVAPNKNLVPLPDSVPTDVAAVLACSGMSAVHAVRISGAGLGDVAVVDGIGGVGLMVIQVAKAAGARVIAVGDRPDKLDLAKAGGADEVMLVADAEEYSLLAGRLDAIGARPDKFFETVGTTASMRAGYEALAAGGSFVQIGYTKDRIDTHPSTLIRNELRLLTSAAGSLADLETAIQLAASGALKPVIRRRDGLEELPNALDEIRNRTILGRSVLSLG